MNCRAVIIVAIALELALAAVPAQAEQLQLPPGKWWENERVQARVNLSEEQRQQIRDLVYDHAHRMIDLAANVRKAELELKDLADQSDFDPSTVRSAFNRFQKARQQLEAERFELLLSIRQTLSTEQWKTLSALRDEVKRWRGEGQRQEGFRRGQRPRGVDRSPR